MKKNHLSPLLLVLLLLPYGTVFVFNSSRRQNIWILGNFTEISRHLFLVMTLFIFIGVIWIGSLKPPTVNTYSVKFPYSWGVGFAFMIAIALGLAIYVNPHAHFDSNLFPSLTPNARSIKTELYKQKVDDTDIVILGSSRAFTLSPEYIEKKTGYSAFNMSVEGGRVGDFALQLNYLLKSNNIPKALVLDVSQTTLVPEYMNSDLQPLALIPYMPASMAFLVAEKSLQDILGFQSLSDSVYLLSLPNLQNRVGEWAFEKDGMGVRKPLTHEQYMELLSATIESRRNVMLCKHIDLSAKQMLEATIELAEANNIAIILYESPMHATFYEIASQKDPNGFLACRRLISDYLVLLSETHPNVLSRDLSDYKLVNDLKEEGFYDAVHLRPGAAELVVNALIPEIDSAMAWSLENR